MLSIIKNIPDIKQCPLKYIFETLKIKHNDNTLWLEFGVATGNSINYISKFTENKIYGFDCFEGLPERWRIGYEKGCFSTNGILPEVNKNVILIKGLFQDTLLPFIKKQNKKVSFIHIDCDLYSSTKFILNTLKDYFEKDCIIVFDELVNFREFDSDNSELRAFYEFINENNIKYNWIGMNGEPIGVVGSGHQNVGVIINI